MNKDHLLAQKINLENTSTIQLVQKEIASIVQTDITSDEKIAQIVSLVFKRQDMTDDLLRQGFIGISVQNAELLKENQKLHEETKRITKQLNEILEKQALIEEKKRKRKNRKRLPQKDPMTEEIYQYLIQRSIQVHHETYQGARLRL